MAILKYKMDTMSDDSALAKQETRLDRLLDRCKSKAEYTHLSLKGGKYYIASEDIETFTSLYKESVRQGRRLYLTERHRDIGPVVIDLDFRQSDNIRKYTKQHIKGILYELMKVLDEYVSIESGTELYVLEKGDGPRPTKSNGYKDGIHIIMPTIVTKPNMQHYLRYTTMKNIGNDILHDCKYDNAYDDIYDEAVIERNGWLMYGSNKPDETNKWSLTQVYRYENGSIVEADDRNKYTSDELVEMFMLRNKYDSSKLKLDVPAIPTDTKSVTSIPQSSASATVRVLRDAEKQQITALVNMLNISRATDFNKWMKVGWCLHNISIDFLQTWKEFSKQSTQYDEVECERLWNKMIYRTDGIKEGSLHMWAKEDNKEEYIQLMVSQNSQHNCTTIEEINGSSETFEYGYVKNIFEKTNCLIKMQAIYLEESDGIMYFRDKHNLKEVYFNLFCHKMVFDKSGNKTSMRVKFIPEWAEDVKIRTYKKMDFLPPPKICPENVYNLWKGFAIDNIVAESSGNIEPFLEHCRMLCGYNILSFDFFIKWLAQGIQEPGKLNGIAIIFKSREGAGKNAFFDHYGLMIGPQYYFETCNPEKDIFGRFANGRKYKLLIDFDETNAKCAFANSESIKNLITSTHFNYEQKGIDPVELSNFARIVFTTNNLLCAKITDQTRRFTINETSDIKIGDQEYFKGFSEYMNNVTNQKAIMEYLRSIDISKVNWIKDRPMNDTYNVIKGLCAEPIQKYLYYVWENNQKNNKVIKRASTLLDEYKDYLIVGLKFKEDKISFINKTTFGLELKELLKNASSGVTKYRDDKGVYYEFNIDILKTHLVSKGLILDFIDYE